MVKCHKCGHDNEEGHEFCEECGSKLKVELKCKKCGHHLKPDDDFCEECGAKVKESKAQPHERKTESELAKYKWWIIGTGIFMIFAVVFVFAVPVPYTAKEGYTEKVPYEVQETYSEKEPITLTVPDYVTVGYKDIKYIVESTSPKSFQGASGYIGIESEINFVPQESSLDATSSNFCWKYTYYITRHGIKVYEDSEQRVYCLSEKPHSLVFSAFVFYDPGKGYTEDYHQLKVKYNEELSQHPDYYDFKINVLSSPQTPIKEMREKLIINSSEVQKTRTVTKYKDEYKERIVTKYATLFQRLSGQAKYYYKV